MMTEREIQLIIGALLHDVGKVLFRQGDYGRTDHSTSGYCYLKSECGLEEQEEILDCVRYHHAKNLQEANIKENSLAYIVYLADNIASAADRRENGEEWAGFDQKTPLESVFNLLNQNTRKLYYRPDDLNTKNGINFPQVEKLSFDQGQYTLIKKHLTDHLKGWVCKESYVNSLLAVMEADLSFVPSSTARKEVADISLYDHVKITAAVASCIYAYLQKNGVTNYKQALFQKEKEARAKNMFLLCSLELSGIQDFIYTIASKNALKTLRARSFYVELLLEHLADELLGRLHLSRANLIHIGGGHCQLLLPNTQEAKEQFRDYLSEMNEWLLKEYRTKLFLAGGYALCSHEDLRDNPRGSYYRLYQMMKQMVVKQKLHRYSAQQIRYLNQNEPTDHSRECKVCKRLGAVDTEGVCGLCRRFEQFSQSVLNADFFAVLSADEDGGLALPGGYFLIPESEEGLRERIASQTTLVRAYAKNQFYIGEQIATKIWVGDYSTDNRTFEDLANAGEGIKRIAVLRLDVDDLGEAIRSGFERSDSPIPYATLSRTATLSRMLSLFFQYYVREILENGMYSMNERAGRKKREAAIIYSGGDDLFVVGAWKDVIEFAIDFKKNFERYTEGTLTVSAGIGIYTPGYPIRAIAAQTQGLENASKHLKKKTAITVFEDGCRHDTKDQTGISDGTYTWEEFEKGVIGEKYRTLQHFFALSDEHGMAFMYKLLELIRNRNERINFARFVYLLSRLEPREEGEKKEQYRVFLKQMGSWYGSEKDCRELKTAMTMYAYTYRNGGNESEN